MIIFTEIIQDEIHWTNTKNGHAKRPAYSILSKSFPRFNQYESVNW